MCNFVRIVRTVPPKKVRYSLCKSENGKVTILGDGLGWSYRLAKKKCLKEYYGECKYCKKL